MPNQIIDFLTLGHGNVRSISLERDLYQGPALGSYMVTPATVAALEQLGSSLQASSPQRAWKVVGPYGSGKSALGVVIGQLLAGKELFPSIAKAVETHSPKTYQRFASSRRYPVALVGSRTSLGVSMARTLNGIVSDWGTKEAKTFLKRLDEGRGKYNGSPLNAAVGAMATDFAAAAATKDFSGVVFLIDELGKFVEHAALHPDEGDLMALQQLAETASGHVDTGISVIAFLHQHLTSYAGNVGKSLSDDWEKVASRFEEIPFDEPPERYAHFAHHALGVSPSARDIRGLQTKAASLYSQAISAKVLSPQSQGDHALFSKPEELYPLHPAVISTMAIVSKRFGQSERSFHAFLRGDEQNAVKDFAQREAGADTWYRLDNLYDYLATGHGLRFRERNAERKWAFSVSIISRAKPDTIESRVLKTIAVLELVSSAMRRSLSADLIVHALDDVKSKDIRSCIDEAVEKGHLTSRYSGQSIGFAAPEIANIDALLEEASKEDEGKLLLDALGTALTARPVIAHRHYDRTGTLRTMGILVGTLDAWPEAPKSNADEATPDGWLKLLVTTSNPKSIKACVERCKAARAPLMVHAALPLEPAAKLAFVAYATWLQVSEKLRAKHLDPWATQYVERQLARAKDEVDSVLTTLLEQDGSTTSRLRFWHFGKEISPDAALNLSQLASHLFDDQFSLAPVVVNELINKDKPASAIVLARQRLFETLFSGDTTRQVYQPHEFPPERLIHQTLLVDAGLWSEHAGHWSLHAPTDHAKVKIGPVWRAISDALCRDAGVQMDELLSTLCAPPYGLRGGPAGIWLAIYLLVNRSNCAVFERGTLVLELTAEHLQRMYKSPGVFTLREVRTTAESQQLLGDYRAALASVGCQIDGQPTHLEIARTMYRWIARLPAYAMKTNALGKEAKALKTQIDRSRDHIELLGTTLPRIYAEAKTKQSFRAWMSQALSDLGSAYRELQERVTTTLGTSFEIQGGLSRIRAQLQKECKQASVDLAEAHLKSFVLRCADPTLSDERWLDSLSSLIVHKPLDAWDDGTLSKFEGAVIELCAHYRRWLQLLNHRSRNPAVSERFVSLTMTLPNGKESSVFAVSTPRTKAMADEVLKLLGKSAKDDPEAIVAALGQALLQLHASTDKENSNDQRQAG